MNTSSAQITYSQITHEARAMLASRIREFRRKKVSVKFRWKEKKWPISVFCKNSASGKISHAIFLRPTQGRGDPKSSSFLIPWIEQLAKVIAALWLCETAKTAERLRDIMLAIRWLNEGVLGTEASNVNDLLPIHFERAVEAIKSQIKNKNIAFDTAEELKLIANKIDDLGLSDAKLRFFHRLENPPRKIVDRTVKPLVQDALYHCINNPMDENEQRLMEILRLHFAWGGRIGETLRLPSSLHYQDNSNAVVKLSSDAPKNKQRYGIRYFPEKLFDNGTSIKPMDVIAGSIIEKSVVKLEEMCKFARERAQLLASTPGRFPLPKRGTDEFHKVDDLVTLEDIGYWMNWNFVPFSRPTQKPTCDPQALQLNTRKRRRTISRWGIQPVEKPKGDNKFEDSSWALGRGLHAFKYRVGDFENYFLKTLELNVITSESGRTIAKLHELLIVVFDNQLTSFSPVKNPIPLMPRKLTYATLQRQLSSKTHSIFSRRGIDMPDGSPVRVRSHGGRHDRNKDLDEAGLSQVQQALAMGRTASQNIYYQGGSDIHLIQQSNIARLRKESQQERARIVKSAIKDKTIAGAVTSAYHALREINFVKAEEFLDEQVGQVLVTRYGACTNEWTGQACPKHNKCFKNCKHLHLTGSESERDELKKELAIQYLHRAKVQELANEGTYKADTALEAIDTGISGIEKALRAWEEAASQRRNILTKSEKLTDITVSIQVYKNGASHFKELIPRSTLKRAP